MERKLLLICLIFVIAACCWPSHGQTTQRRSRPNSHRRVTPQKIKNSNRGNANERTDCALKFVEDVMLGEEPIQVLDLPSPCSTCTFHGITQMNRNGPVTIIDVDDNRRRIQITLFFPNINVTCDCVFGYIVSGKVDVKMLNFTMYMDVIVNYEVEDTEVRTIKVIDPGIVDFQFDGYGILGNIIDKFVWLFQGMLNNRVCSIVQRVVPKILREEKRKRLFHLGYLRK